MESNESSEVLLSQRDLPLWARGVAIGLLLFASWWFFNTEGIRSVVGDSIGALCLGVIAASILQGMRLPFALWPDGPWRKQFSVPAVVATAVLLAAMILLSGAATSDVLSNQIDLGTGIAVVVGSVGLGFAAGFVKQRRYLAWYGIASGLAILPLACELVFRSPDVNGAAFKVALFPSLVFLTAIGLASKVVTEEIAFRRMLIGIVPGAGLLSILASTITALLWLMVLSQSGIGGTGIIVLGTLGALCAGCIYVLSKSLLVSALFSAVYTAGYWSLAFANTPDGAITRIDTAPRSMWIAASVVGVALAILIVKRNGFFGNLREAASTDATRS